MKHPITLSYVTGTYLQPIGDPHVTGTGPLAFPFNLRNYCYFNYVFPEEIRKGGKEVAEPVLRRV